MAQKNPRPSFSDVIGGGQSAGASSFSLLIRSRLSTQWRCPRYFFFLRLAAPNLHFVI